MLLVSSRTSCYFCFLGQFLKRCRNEAFSPQPDWKSLVQSQAQEIEILKSDKASIESSLNRIKGDQEKILNENRILKRAVTIQQERQNQAMSEIGAARQFKFEAEDRIKKLEHLISSLRYHLQTQQSNPGNDFMGFPPRPPDVY
jgi:chromosome segregation ATPase